MDLRELCKSVSSYERDLDDRLEMLIDDPDWTEIRLAILVVANSIVRDAIQPSVQFATLATFLASIHPAVRSLSGVEFDELVYRVSIILRLDAVPPARFLGETEEESEERAAVIGIFLFFFGVDPWTDGYWNALIELLEECDDIQKREEG